MELKVTGSIPAYAAGTLYRTGPGTYKTETENGKTIAASHWFDGFTQVHRFQILPPSASGESTRVTYNSRRSVDTLIEYIRETGNISIFTFGQKRDPCESFFKKTMSMFSASNVDKDKPDSRNMGVTLSVNMPGLEPPPSHSNHSDGINTSGIASLLNKTDANGFQLLDPVTLEPIGLSEQNVLHPDLKGPLSATHAKTDPLTGDVFNFNLELSSKATYRVFSISASTQKTSILATITDAPPAYLHSTFLTPNHVILCVWGSHIALGGLKMLYTRNMMDAMNPLDPSQPCRWYVIDRSPEQRGVMATYTSSTFFAFHTINAYEEPSSTSSGGTDIIADVVCYDDLSILKRFYYENLMSSSPNALDYQAHTPKGQSARAWMGRYRLPNIPTTTPDANPTKLGTKGRQVIREFAAARDQSVELPVINPRFLNKKHRFVYGVTDTGKSTFFDGLAKFDSHTQTSVFWSEKGHSAGEPIFVVDPDGEAEDSGVLLSVVLDGYRQKSYLLVLDARDLSVVGRADVDGKVGFGFHGVHVSSSSRVGQGGKALALNT